MLRVQIRDASNRFLIKIEGRLSGEYADSIQATMIAHLNTSLDLVVDMTDVTFVDASGEVALTFFKRLGAVFVAENSYSRYICERLRLPLSGKNKSNGHDRIRDRKAEATDLPGEHPPEVDNPNAISDL